MSDRPRFHAEKNRELISGSSPDLQVRLHCSSLRIFRLPRITEWLVEASFPDYSGGTVPDSHRLPCYALAGTRNV
jgi:hypothetical protein